MVAPVGSTSLERPAEGRRTCGTQTARLLRLLGEEGGFIQTPEQAPSSTREADQGAGSGQADPRRARPGGPSSRGEAIPGPADPTTLARFSPGPVRHFTHPSCSHLPSGPARSFPHAPFPLGGHPHLGCPGRPLRQAPDDPYPAAARPPLAHGPRGLARGRVCAGSRRWRPPARERRPDRAGVVPSAGQGAAGAPTPVRDRASGPTALRPPPPQTSRAPSAHAAALARPHGRRTGLRRRPAAGPALTPLAARGAPRSSAPRRHVRAGAAQTASVEGKGGRGRPRGRCGGGGGGRGEWRGAETGEARSGTPAREG